MAKLVVYSIVLAMLVGLVVVTGTPRLRSSARSDAITGVTDTYLACAAYYQLTADILHHDADDDVAGQYRDRAALALDVGAALSGGSVTTMTKDLNRLAAALADELAVNGHDLGELGRRYDDQCLALLDE